jgi:hypothetical protein
MPNPLIQGRLLQNGLAAAEVASIRWTIAEGKPVAWTGWLTLADNAPSLASGRFTLRLDDGSEGTILLMAKAGPGQPVPFCFALPPPRCKPAR